MGTNFSGLVGSCIWRVLILAIFDASPQMFTFIEKYEAQRYKGPVEGNFEDATAAILRSLKCGGDQEST